MNNKKFLINQFKKKLEQFKIIKDIKKNSQLDNSKYLNIQKKYNELEKEVERYKKDILSLIMKIKKEYDK